MRAAAFVGVLIVTALAPAARADTTATVIVLPFTAADDELAIYGKPVADAVAKGLGGEDVNARAAVGKSAKGDLVVELRVTREKRKLRLEAIARDPELGETVASASAKPVPLSRLDAAAAEVAKRLRDKVAAAARVAATRRAAAAKARVDAAAKPDAKPEATKPDAKPEATKPEATKPEPTDQRPALLVYQPDGRARGGFAPIGAIAQAAIDAAVTQLGYRPIASTTMGLVDPTFAAGDAQRATAAATIMLRMTDVDFAWRGGKSPLGGAGVTVLTARGSVRVKLVAAAGRVLLDRTVTTDTLVGSRGDSHDALVRFIVRQALEILRNDLARALQGSK